MQAGNEKDENWDGVWNICIPIFKYLLELYLSYKYSLFFFFAFSPVNGAQGKTICLSFFSASKYCFQTHVSMS